MKQAPAEPEVTPDYNHEEVAAMGSRTDRMKQDARAFYDLMFNECRPREAIERYAGDSYRQHNPHVGDGKEAFVAYFEKMAAEYPGKRVECKRAVADGRLLDRPRVTNHTGRAPIQYAL